MIKKYRVPTITGFDETLGVNLTKWNFPVGEDDMTIRSPEYNEGETFVVVEVDATEEKHQELANANVEEIT